MSTYRRLMLRAAFSSFGRCAGLAMVLVLAGAGGAQAFVVSVEGDRVVYRAEPGHVDEVVPKVVDGSLVFRTTDPAAAGPGCVVVSGGVGCPLAGAAGFDATLGDGDDTFVAPADLPFGVSVDGGPGDDTIKATRFADRIDGGPGDDQNEAGRGDDTIDSVDGEFENVACGAGDDHVRADFLDSVPAFACEHLRRTTTGGIPSLRITAKRVVADHDGNLRIPISCGPGPGTCAGVVEALRPIPKHPNRMGDRDLYGGGPGRIAERTAKFARIAGGQRGAARGLLPFARRQALRCLRTERVSLFAVSTDGAGHTQASRAISVILDGSKMPRMSAWLCTQYTDDHYLDD